MYKPDMTKVKNACEESRDPASGFAYLLPVVIWTTWESFFLAVYEVMKYG